MQRVLESAFHIPARDAIDLAEDSRREVFQSDSLEILYSQAPLCFFQRQVGMYWT